LVPRLFPTGLMRDADEGGGVRLSFITNNRLYQLEVQTEDSPTSEYGVRPYLGLGCN
jgi:hypothetical protein